MNKRTKILICVLAIFIVGMTLSVAFAEPVEAKKYKNKIYMPGHVLLLCWKMVDHVCLDGRPLSRCYHLNVVLRLHVQCQKRQPLFLRSRTRKRKEL